MPIAGKRNIYSKRTEEEKLRAQKAIDNHVVPFIIRGSAELNDIILEQKRNINNLISQNRRLFSENQTLKRDKKEVQDKYNLIKGLIRNIPNENLRHFEDKGGYFNTDTYGDLMEYSDPNRLDKNF